MMVFETSHITQKRMDGEQWGGKLSEVCGQNA